MQAERTDRETLANCGDATDGDGVPMAMYAAERLLDGGRNHMLVSSYVVRAVNLRSWPSPNETHVLRSLLHRIPSTVAAEPLRRLTQTIHDIEQVAALARDLQAHPDRLQRVSRAAPGDLPWMAYGDEPWLVTLVSPTSFAAPIVMAVSSRRTVPAGVTLRADLRGGPVGHARCGPSRFTSRCRQRHDQSARHRGRSRYSPDGGG